MKTTLRVFSVASSIVGVFWGSFALATGFREGGQPYASIPEAAGFFFLGAAGWAVFGALAQIFGALGKARERRSLA